MYMYSHSLDGHIIHNDNLLITKMKDTGRTRCSFVNRERLSSSVFPVVTSKKLAFDLQTCTYSSSLTINCQGVDDQE